MTLSGAAVAQEQRLPGVIDRLPKEIPKEVTKPKPPEAVKVPEPQLAEAPPEPFATLKKVTFEGDIILSEAVLQRAVASYLNRPLTLQDIAKLKYDLTKLYFDRGYVLVKVTTPPQDLAGGVLRTVIYPGRMGGLEITGTGLNPAVTRSMTGQLHRGDVFSERTVETSIKDIDDINNIRARLTLKPGTEVGTSDMVLFTEPAVEDVQTFMVDNYESELVGRLVGSMDVRKTNLLKFGESIRLYARQSEEDLTTFLGEYRMPILVRDVFLELKYLWSENGIHDRLAFLDASGRTRQYGIALSGNFVNMIQRQSSWRLGIEHSRNDSFLFDKRDTRDDITNVYLDLSYLLRKPKYVVYGLVRFSKGMDFLGADRQGELNASRPGNPYAWRIMPTIYTNISFTERDFLQLVAFGQLSSDALLASELFVLGGYGSVRGFEPAQEVGETGFSFNADYNHTFYSTDRLNIKAGPFLDGGAVANRIKDTAVDSNLYSVGIGGEAKVMLTKTAESKLRLDWAHPIGTYKSNQVDDNSFYIRFTQSFVF